MKLAHYMLREPLCIGENSTVVLVLENGAAFRDCVRQLKSRTEGMDGDWVLSRGGEILDIAKYAELISDPLSVEFDSKRIQARINKAVCAAALEDPAALTQLLAAVNSFAAGLLPQLDFSAGFNELESIEPLIKLLDYHIDTEGMGYCEQLLEYMKLCRDFFGKELFIIINLKGSMTGAELEAFYKNCFYEKLRLLLIESHDSRSIPQMEKKRIIDADLCEI